MAPEEVHLEDDVTSERKGAGLDVLVGFSVAEYRIECYHRKLIRAGDTELSSRGTDALHRHLQIVVLLQCRPNEFL